jgi:hypothetical protein
MNIKKQMANGKRNLVKPTTEETEQRFNSIIHKIKPLFQPDNFVCRPTSMAMKTVC